MHYSRKILYYWTKDGCIHPLLCILAFATLLVDAFCEDFTDGVCKQRRDQTLVCLDGKIKRLSQSHQIACLGGYLVFSVPGFLLPSIPTKWKFNLSSNSSSDGKLTTPISPLWCLWWSSSHIVRGFSPHGLYPLGFPSTWNSSVPFPPQQPLSYETVEIVITHLGNCFERLHILWFFSQLATAKRTVNWINKYLSKNLLFTVQALW